MSHFSDTYLHIHDVRSRIITHRSTLFIYCYFWDGGPDLIRITTLLLHASHSQNVKYQGSQRQRTSTSCWAPRRDRLSRSLVLSLSFVCIRNHTIFKQWGRCYSRRAHQIRHFSSSQPWVRVGNSHPTTDGLRSNSWSAAGNTLLRRANYSKLLPQADLADFWLVFVEQTPCAPNGEVSRRTTAWDLLCLLQPYAWPFSSRVGHSQGCKLLPRSSSQSKILKWLSRVNNRCWSCLEFSRGRE